MGRADLTVTEADLRAYGAERGVSPAAIDQYCKAAFEGATLDIVYQGKPYKIAQNDAQKLVLTPTHRKTDG